jgi:2-keto-4-pentenoate hydratase
MSIELATAVEDFWTARARGEFFPQAYVDRLTLDEAYRIQLALIDRRVAAGERQIGWKVGLTAKPIQQQFGFHEPVFACVRQFPLQAGDIAVAEFSGIGRVEVGIAKA